MPRALNAARHEHAEHFPKTATLVRGRHRLAIVIGLVLVLLVQWIAIGYWIRQEFRETQSRAEQVLGQLTVAVHEQTLRLFKDVEGSLKMVDFWLGTHPGSDPRTDPEVVRLLRLIRDTSDGLIDIRLLSADGETLYGPGAGDPSAMNAVDRGGFQIEANPNMPGLTIGRPARSRFTQQLVIPVSLPLSKPAEGVSLLFASIPVSRLVPMYEQIRFKAGGAISLIRTDGILLSRAPFDLARLGTSLADSPDYKQHLGIQQRAIYTSPNTAIDGVARLVSFSRLDEYPLIVAISAGSEATFESWTANRRLIIGGGVLRSLLLIAAAAGIVFVLGVMQRSERQLQLQALYDALTGCLNRHAFDEASKREFARSGRYQRPLTIITLDLDHFKRVNDNHGHPAGDAVLRTLANVWAQTLRAADLMGRLGGEEFAILMPDTDVEQGMLIAQRLLDVTRETTVLASDETLHVTVSIGIAASMPSDRDFGDLMERADNALYHAKRMGRDRIEWR